MSVPVSARTSAVLPWSTWPAVPSVCSVMRGRRSTAAATTATSSSVSVRASSSRRPSSSAADHGRRRRARSAACSAPRGSGSAAALEGQRQRRHRPAADARLGVDDLAADGRGQPLGARAHVAERARAPCAAPGCAPRPRRVAVQAQRRLQRGERRACRCARARASGWRRMRSTASRVPAMMPLCGPPSSLSPEKQTSVAPAAMRAAGVGLAGEHRVGRRAGPSRGRPAPARRARAPMPASVAVSTSSVKPTMR